MHAGKFLLLFPPLKLTKSVNETFVMLQNIYVTNKGCSFELSVHQIILIKKMQHI